MHVNSVVCRMVSGACNGTFDTNHIHGYSDLRTYNSIIISSDVQVDGVSPAFLGIITFPHAELHVLIHGTHSTNFLTG